jgi:hypothetical protein
MRSHLLLLAVIAILSIPIDAVTQKSYLAETKHNLNWPHSTADVPNANKIPLENIESFLDSLRDITGKIQEFRFVPIEADRIALAATFDVNGRGFYAIEIVFPEGNKFRTTIFGSANDDHFLPMEVIDLDGDGFFEVLSKKTVLSYRGAGTDPIYWYDIYKFQSGVPHEVDAKFPKFYGNGAQPHLGYISDLLYKAKEPKVFELQQAQIEFVRQKFNRKILGDKNAGLQEALKWAISANRYIQELAINTFQEIPCSESLKQLDRLSQSKDSNISLFVKSALKKLQANIPQ